MIKTSLFIVASFNRDYSRQIDQFTAPLQGFYSRMAVRELF